MVLLETVSWMRPARPVFGPMKTRRLIWPVTAPRNGISPPTAPSMTNSACRSPGVRFAPIRMTPVRVMKFLMIRVAWIRATA